MTERLSRSWWLRLLAEIALWQGLALVFLYLYVGHFDAPTTAIRPHMSLLGTLWLGLVCVRLASWKWITNHRGPHWIVAIVTVLALSVLLLYYTLVLVGLAS